MKIFHVYMLLSAPTTLYGSWLMVLLISGPMTQFCSLFRSTVVRLNRGGLIISEMDRLQYLPNKWTKCKQCQSGYNGLVA